MNDEQRHKQMYKQGHDFKSLTSEQGANSKCPQGSLV